MVNPSINPRLLPVVLDRQPWVTPHFEETSISLRSPYSHPRYAFLFPIRAIFDSGVIKPMFKVLCILRKEKRLKNQRKRRKRKALRK